MTDEQTLVETPAAVQTEQTADVNSPSPETSEIATNTVQQDEAKTEKQAEKQPEYNIEEVYPELVAAKNNKTALDVTGLRRVRGGILVAYKNMPLFLPTSHLSLKPNPSENELLGMIQKVFPVHIHELNDEDKTKVIVTRRRLLRLEHLHDFKVGQVVEGKVVSMTEFGAFINLGGVDGMVHVSAMSRRRINHPSEFLKKGDTVRAVVKEINEANQRLSLSMKELEEDPWKDAAKEFTVGSVNKGKVKSLTDFGAYIELKPGVEGLVHISEMSWARRIKHPSELFQVGQEIDVHVLEISEEKHKVSLGYKQTQPNPWSTIKDRFTVGQQVSGVVREAMNRGVVVNIADDVDAFMPRGKMHPSLRGKNAPFQVGDKIDGLFVMDVVPENHSLILGMEGFDQGSNSEGKPEGGGNRNGGRPPRGDREPRAPRNENSTPLPEKKDVTLSDLLSDDEKRKLFGSDSN